MTQHCHHRRTLSRCALPLLKLFFQLLRTVRLHLRSVRPKLHRQQYGRFHRDRLIGCGHNPDDINLAINSPVLTARAAERSLTRIGSVTTARLGRSITAADSSPLSLGFNSTDRPGTEGFSWATPIDATLLKSRAHRRLSLPLASLLLPPACGDHAFYL